MEMVDSFRAIMSPESLVFSGGDLHRKEVERATKWWSKTMAGWKQIYDYNADSGLKRIFKKGKKLRLLTFVYGNVQVFDITDNEMKIELKRKGDDTEGWTKVKNAKIER